MSLKVLNASGYLSGSASLDAGVKIESITFLPGSDDGSLKIDEGIDGADSAVVQLIEVLESLTPWTIYLDTKIVSIKRTFVTLVNCKCVIGYS